MEYVTEFYESLGNRYTVLLIAFITGFAIGVNKFVGSSLLMGLLIGVIFAVAAGLIWAFLNKMYPKNINVSLNLAPLVTIVLLILFFFVVATEGVDKFFSRMGQTINIATTEKRD
jgi:predicted PurR-regulated permease PerM